MAYIFWHLFAEMMYVEILKNKKRKIRSRNNSSYIFMMNIFFSFSLFIFSYFSLKEKITNPFKREKIKEKKKVSSDRKQNEKKKRDFSLCLGKGKKEGRMKKGIKEKGLLK